MTTTSASILPVAFYERPALVVARELLGKILRVSLPGMPVRTGRIVETEAYVSERDLACHASKGRTPRTEPLFGPPAKSYVYLIYGMHHCFNVVCEPDGFAAAVLVRGLEPLEGFGEDNDAGVRMKSQKSFTDGPGKLCKALGLTRAQDSLSLLAPPVELLDDGMRVSPRRIRRGPRVGVDYAGEWAAKPYRFWVDGNPHVSPAGGARLRRKKS